MSGSDDSDRTVIRPVPGGRRSTPSSVPPPTDSAEERLGAGNRLPQRAARAAPAMPEPDRPAVPQRSGTGASPLLAAAAPLLQLIARLHNTAHAPDAAALRQNTERQLQAFDREALAAGVPRDQVQPAHEALGAALGDVVANTPWGSQGAWAAPLQAGGSAGGRRFFDILGQAREQPARFQPLLELLYLCLSLGVAGPYHQSPEGRAEIERLRQTVYAALARGRPASAALAPDARGVSAPYRPARVEVPIWVGAAIALATAGALYVWCSLALNTASDALYARLLDAPPALMPAISRTADVPPPQLPAAAPSALEHLRAALAPQIAHGDLVVTGTPAAPVIRVPAKKMFRSSGATVLAAAAPLLHRIGAALHAEAGQVQVIGYTDAQPIRTAAFPSGFALSAARAKAAAAVIAIDAGPSRVGSEGRGAADPVADNVTAAGREKNRRLDIVLHPDTP